MKKLILIALGILLWAVSYSQVEDYEVVAWDDLTTLGNFTIDDDTMRNTTQIGVLDTTLVTLDYLGLNFVKNPADSLQFYREAVTTGHNAYKVDVDTTNGALRFYNDEVDIAMQMGQELWMKVKNNNGSTFLNGIIVYISGSESGFPTVLIAHDRDFETVGAIGMLTHDVEAGTFGFLTTYGTVGGLDTSGETPGAIVYVDTLNGGKNWTTTIPEFANFQYEIGFIHTVDPTEGKIFLNPKGQVDDVMHNINNANILENFNFTSASNGTTITGTLESADGKDYLTVRWSDGFAKIAVPVTITIPEGTDNDSQTSYIYIPKSTGVLTSSTSYFPIGTQYKTISRTEAWTALRTQTEGLKGNQNYNDFVASTVSLRGRIAQIGNWQRLRSLKYINGSNGTVTVRTNAAAPDTVTYAVTQGNWSQANEQVLDAMDMFTGDDIHAFNYPDHTDTTLFDLNEILVDATGTSLANRSWTFVYWISQNKTGEQSHMYVNLPNGSYSSGAAAEADALGYKVTEIPYEMRPYSGFVTEVVMTHTNPSGGTWTVYSSTNIQGNEPGYAGGGGGEGGTGTFDLLSDTPASKAGSSNKIVGVDLGEANLEYKNVTIDGSGTINIPTGEEYQINGNNLKLTDLDSTGILFTQSQVVGLVDSLQTKGDVFKVGTPVDNQIGVWTGDGTLEGESNLTYSVSTLTTPIIKADDGVLTAFLKSKDDVTSATISTGTGTMTMQVPHVWNNRASSPSASPGMVWYNTTTDEFEGRRGGVSIQFAATGDIGGGTVTSVSSLTTDQLTVANGTTTPDLTIVTGVVVDAGTALATGDQIHTFVTDSLATKWNNDGTSTATGDWDIGVFDFDAVDGNFSGVVTGAGLTSTIDGQSVSIGSTTFNSKYINFRPTNSSGANIGFSSAINSGSGGLLLQGGFSKNIEMWVDGISTNFTSGTKVLSLNIDGSSTFYDALSVIGGVNIGDIINTPTAGGIKLARSSTSEPFILFENDDGNNGLAQIRGINGGGLRITRNDAGVDWLTFDSSGDAIFSGSATADDFTATTGATIDKFSTDGTLAGNSDTAVPTEKAVKTYVDDATQSISIKNFTATAVSSDIVLGATSHTYVNSGTSANILMPPSPEVGRIIVIVNRSGTTALTFKNSAGTAITYNSITGTASTIPTQTSVSIQYDGSIWWQIH